MYKVYILQSEKTLKYYIGCTTDLTKRLSDHNSGKTLSTKPYRPWKIVYTELYDDKHVAFKREWFLKHPVGYQTKLDIIRNLGGFA